MVQHVEGARVVEHRDQEVMVVVEEEETELHAREKVKREVEYHN